MGGYQENKLDGILETIYSPIYTPSVDVIHTFNTVCNVNKKWVVTFESTMPRTSITASGEWKRKCMNDEIYVPVKLEKKSFDLMQEESCLVFYLRPLDIAVYVGRGAIDVGITGQDLLKNSGTAALEHMPLGFGSSTFRFAAPNESPITTLEDIQGKRVATTFDKLVHDYLVEHGIEAETIHLDGAVESSVQLGVADLIADVVSTGTTLRNAGLRVFSDPLMHSEACLIRSPRLDEKDSRLAVLTRRLQGVLTAHQYVLMDYDIPVSKVSAAVAVTPGFESPTISPLHDKQWNAVRVMVPKAEVNQLMDDLYEVGARGIIVTALQASRM